MYMYLIERESEGQREREREKLVCDSSHDELKHFTILTKANRRTH
jgi:hypothetical protein